MIVIFQFLVYALEGRQLNQTNDQRRKLPAKNSYNLPSLLTMALENRQHFVAPLLVSPAKGHLRSNCRYSILMTCRYPGFGWGFSLVLPRRKFASSNQIPTPILWGVTCHTQRISALVSQTSFCGETSASIVKCQLFTQAMLSSITVIDSNWWKVYSQNK